MRIVVENGGYELRNVGDTALLQVCAERLWERWPNANVTVLTTDPHRLAQALPQATPLACEGRDMLLRDWSVLGGFHHIFPGRTKRLARVLESALRARWPNLAAQWAISRVRRHRIDLAPMRAFLNAVRNADLVVAAGGGYFTDEFPRHASSTAFTFALAHQIGKPTALFGQGLGPLEDVRLRRALQKVCSNAAVVALREGREGPRLLEKVGAVPDRVLITGDDAVEMAYRQRRQELGIHIGLNVRKSYYSGLENEQFSRLRAVLGKVTSDFKASIVPLPISWYETESELDNIRSLADGLSSALWDSFGLDTPRGVIQQAGQCRLVITGSYHAGVFALSQGIPAVCLVRSTYYEHKFLGLAGEFGEGCWVVSIDAPEFGRNLSDAVSAAWKRGETLRSSLLKAAKNQIERQRTAYQRFFDIVEQKRRNVKERQ